jgi:hypothetical protein
MYNVSGIKKYLLIFFSLIVIDQFTKYIIRYSSGFYICNANLSFGLKPSCLLFFTLALIIILFLISIGNSKHKILNSKQVLNPNDKNSKRGFKNLNFIFLNLFRISNLEFRISAILVAAGAISNIIDRIYFGCVIDFIDLHFWPVFNLADIYITMGGIILVANLLKKDKK